MGFLPFPFPLDGCWKVEGVTSTPSMGSICVGGKGRKYKVYAVASRLATATKLVGRVDRASKRGM